jgi:hypothetical protein
VRGPFRLLVTRPKVSQTRTVVNLLKQEVTVPTTPRVEWLPGEESSDELEEVIGSLLTDTRDRITHICVWSLREEQFVAHYGEGVTK